MFWSFTSKIDKIIQLSENHFLLYYLIWAVDQTWKYLHKGIVHIYIFGTGCHMLLATMVVILDFQNGRPWNDKFY